MTSVNTSASLMTKSSAWLARQLTNHGSFGAYFEPLIQLFLPQWRTDRCRSKLLEIRQESDDMYSLVIKPSREWSGFKAGQFVELTVQKDGAWVSRFFSISSSPVYFADKGLIEISIRIQPDGQITPWLPKALKSGSVVNLSQAQGEFCLDQNQQPILMIAGGSGITPFRSMLQNMAQLAQFHNTFTSQPICLMYYARSKQHFLFEEEFQQFAGLLPSFELHLIDSEHQGFLNKQQLEELCADFLRRDIYICGPSQMITHGRKLLESLSVAARHVHYEFFGPEPVELEHGNDSANILFNNSNKQISSQKNDHKSLLTLAEEADIKALSGCRIGVCHQCICEKKSGVVYNTKTKQYSDTGRQEIQLCISVAVSDLVLEL